MPPKIRAVVRSLVLLLNTPWARRRAVRTLAAAPRPLKLEIGGLSSRPGWIVTNVNAVTKLYLDATRRWPLEDASVSYVYADNVIEHLSLESTRAMLVEAARCLRPGGVIRLVTPDVRAHVELYLSGDQAIHDHVAQFYRSKGIVVEHPVDLIRVPIGEFGHHLGYMWDFEAAAAELERAGFVAVVRATTGRSSHVELDGLDVRTGEGGVQLAVEASRPA